MVENREKDDLHRKLYELSFGKRPAEELYDCRKDPGQLVNLAGDPDYADIKAALFSPADGPVGKVPAIRVR